MRLCLFAFGKPSEVSRKDDVMMSRELCKLCYHVNTIGFRVPDNVWEDIVPEHARNGVVCLSCFSRIGDEKLIEWDRDIEFYPVSLATHIGVNPDSFYTDPACSPRSR